MNTEISPGRRRAILLLLCITVIVVVMDITIINVALEPIQRGLNTSNAGLQWAVDAYLITFAAFLFTGGVSADRFGRKKILMAGMLLLGGASALAAFSHSVAELVVWRAFMGVGAAVVPTVTLAIIIGIFPPPERPKAIAAWAAAAGVAFAVGPVLGGIMLHNFWWGSIFLINAPLVVVGVALIAFLVPESRNPMNTKFDPYGVPISIVAVGSLVYGLIRGGERNDWLSARTLGPIVAGVLLIAILLWLESRLPTPSLDIRLLKNGRFSAGTVAIALAFFSLIGAIFIASLYFQAVLGYSPLKAGLLMLPMGVGSMFMSSRCPKLVPRFGAGPVVAAGATLMAISFITLSQFGQTTPLTLLIIDELVFGLGWGCIMAPATGALMSVVPPVKAGAGQAVTQTVRQVAGALGVATIGSVLGVVYRSSIGSAVDVLPQGLRDQAAGSLGGTLHAIDTSRDQLKDQAPALLTKARDAYLSGMQVTMIIAGAVALLAAFVALRWLPGRPPAGGPPVGVPATPPAPGTARPLEAAGPSVSAPNA